jgi:hypothetical protein
VESRVQALLEAVDNNPPRRNKTIWRTETSKLPATKKDLRNWWHLKRMPQAPSRRPLVHLTHLINHCLRLSHLPTLWKDERIITLPKPSEDSQFPQNLRLASCPRQASYLRKLF